MSNGHRHSAVGYRKKTSRPNGDNGSALSHHVTVRADVNENLADPLRLGAVRDGHEKSGGSSESETFLDFGDLQSSPIKEQQKFENVGLHNDLLL